MHAGRKISFQLLIATLFVGLTLLVALVLGLVLFHRLDLMTLNEAELRFEALGQRTAGAARAMLKPGKDQVEALAQTRLAQAQTLPERLHFVPYLAAMLSSNSMSSASYIAYPSGEFFLLRKWQETAALEALLAPPPQTVWVAQSSSLERGKRVGRFHYFSQDLQLIGERESADYQFDPRERPWYQAAMAHTDGRARAITPYQFSSSGRLGLTFSVQVERSGVVAGSDIRLSALGDLLAQNQVSPSTRTALLGADGSVLTLQKGRDLALEPALIKDGQGLGRLPRLEELDAPILQQLLTHFAVGQSESLEFQEQSWIGMKQELILPDTPPLTLLIASPQRELLAELAQLRRHSFWLTIAVLLPLLGLVYLASRSLARPVRQLSAEAQQIQNFEFDKPVEVRSSITEIQELADSMSGMKSTIQSFIQISTNLASEGNFDRLLSLVLSEVAETAEAKGGAIYLHDPGSASLQPAHAYLHGQGQLSIENLRALQLGDEALPWLMLALQSSHVFRLSPQEFTQQFGRESAETQTQSLIALPLRDRQASLVGLLVLPLSEAHVDPGKKALLEAIAGTAAVAIESRRLIEEQRRLLEAFIQLLAGAIDAKSPYTGGHCQRVPELTKLLARAACEAKTGPFAEFQLGESEWETLHLAAWLHDCGKITTPEYVVDKATKLETIYDRIHELRMRFEVLKRDAELTYWQALQRGEEEGALRARLQADLADLDADFAFVASCNQGGEFMDEAKVARLQTIAARTWRRTLSDRLGISHEEALRRQAQAEAPLPVDEPLLADQPWHLLPRSEAERLPADNPWGFKLQCPEFLYNRGELYNLSVARGTLSAEERYKINEHIIQTIKMLEGLPLPRHLAAVPEIAGGHHEKMDGSGYPKGLARQHLSLPARMLAIADIFEALTADDRPYKRGKTLSEALRIMGFMCKDQHIDADLFALFLQSGVYLDYAQRYMKPEAIDAVDIAPFLLICEQMKA
ncbi:hypothetical protein DBR47_03245 [Paucibacter sp. KBW04]|uniref:HD domain-containing phosphohydrolase n=1 Tax=Paucibacter sp. KBW04 TaxID=2153361 RepID=UPI000F55E0A8|nr:HD domain-containing phosphohydrolase [Paucibacter sp. KBW04]RQO63555.1 hypothetical protein DBR47_03245 [Paucibacter sp. KBW04]